MILMRIDKYILWLIILGLGIKLALFIHIAFVNPSSMMQNDSYGYLNDANAWAHYFNQPAEGLKHSLYRTPGYSLFLAIFHLYFNLPLLSIVFLQIVLNVVTAIVVYKTVVLADRQVGLLSAAIVLLDLPTTIFSSMVLTESLHLFVFSLCIFAFVKYINHRKIFWLAGAAILLVITVYIRPVGYYLGTAVAGYTLYLWGRNIATGLIHAILVLVLVYGLLGIWQYHNLKVFDKFIFSNIDNATVHMNGVIGRYSRETDPKLKAMPAPLYYVVSVGDNFLDLMTAPGNMKDFHSKGWKIFGEGFGYLFVVFWWIGLIAGLVFCRDDLVGQFLVLVLVYLMAISIVSTGWHVTPRFRVPMLPSIAILSARGWMALFKNPLIIDAKKVKVKT